MLSSGGESVPARIMRVDKGTNIAVLKAARALRASAPAVATTAKLGDRLVVIGTPLGLRDSLVWCRVSAVDRNLSLAPQVRALQVDLVSTPGLEGAPAFNEAGELVGLIVEWPAELPPAQRIVLEDKNGLRSLLLSPGGCQIDALPQPVAFVVPIRRVWEAIALGMGGSNSTCCWPCDGDGMVSSSGSTSHATKEARLRIASAGR